MYHMFYFREASPEAALRLITINRISLANPMPISYRERIRQVPGVAECRCSSVWRTYKDARDMRNSSPLRLEPEKSSVCIPNTNAEIRKSVPDERTACLVGRQWPNGWDSSS